MRSRIFLAVAALALAGCQSTPAPEAAPPAAAAAPALAAAPVVTGDKTATCTGQAASRYGVDQSALSLSNEYPTVDGDAIDGAATLADGFRRFRCDFSRDGAFVGISDLPQS